MTSPKPIESSRANGMDASNRSSSPAAPQRKEDIMSIAPQAPWEQKTTRPTPQTKEAARSKRTRGEDPAPSPGHSHANLPDDYKQIKGWGADLDPKNRPAVPRELPSDVMTVRGDVKHWQKPRQKIHMS